MRKSILWLAAALAAALVVEGRSVAQPPPDRRPGPPSRLERSLEDFKLSESNRETAVAAVRAYQDNGRRLMDLAGADLQLKMKEILSAEEYARVREAATRSRGGPPGGPGRAPGVDDVVERIMSFDANKDGKISKDELPERMQYLMEKGDANKDGFLDKEEIKKLAAELAKDASPRGVGGPRGRPGADVGFPPRVIERAVDDLKLADKKKEAAAAAVKANQENIRKMTELARADLLVRLDEVLSAEDMKKFKTALERQPGFEDPGRGRPPIPGRFNPFGRGRP